MNRSNSRYLTKPQKERSKKKPEAVAVLICVHVKTNPVDLKLALQSIRNQTYKNIQTFIFCDGPLTESHDKILLRYKRIEKNKIKITRARTPVGLPVGLNTIIEQAIAQPAIKFLARMDADDISMPERFETQVNYLKEKIDTSIVGAWCIEFEKAGKASFVKRLPISFDEIKNFTVYRSPLIHPTVMFRRSVFDNGNRYNINLKSMQDYELWTRLIAEGYRIENIPEFLLWFRIDSDFYSRRSGFKRAMVEIQLRMEYAKRMGLNSKKNYFCYLVLFLLRVSPGWIKKIGYMLRW